MKAQKKYAIESAIKAGLFIKSRLGKSRIVGYKGDINLVTDVDKKAEAIIINYLKKKFSDYSFLAEEGGGKTAKKGYKWVIDPLDGTTNFAHGFPFFCVSVALEKDGKAILGVVYDPMREELFYAEESKGAYLNRKKIHVSKTRKLKKSLLATGFAYNFKKAERSNIENFLSFMLSSRAIRRAGSAALDLCYVACGRFDGFWELGLHPWDTAAGSLIVKQAGGRVTKLDGSPYSHYNKELLSSNGIIHNEMVNVSKKARGFKIKLG